MYETSLTLGRDEFSLHKDQCPDCGAVFRVAARFENYVLHQERAEEDARLTKAAEKAELAERKAQEKQRRQKEQRQRSMQIALEKEKQREVFDRIPSRFDQPQEQHNSEPVCRACRKKIDREAKRCPYCQIDWPLWSNSGFVAHNEMETANEATPEY